MRRWGIVKLAGTARGRPSTADLAQISAGARHLMPHMERTRSQQAVVGSPQQVTSNTEKILNESVHR